MNQRKYKKISAQVKILVAPNKQKLELCALHAIVYWLLFIYVLVNLEAVKFLFPKAVSIREEYHKK